MSVKIEPPKWCSDAVPSNEGWRHPRTNELLISRKGLLDLVNTEKVVETVEKVKKKPKPTKKTVKKD
jgi:hypothetical protein